MARCTRETCRRWRPDSAVRLFGLGLKVDGAWFCSDRCVEAEATRRLQDVRSRDIVRQTPLLRLGTVLLQQHGVTARNLTEALRVQRRSGLRLGDQLQKLGFSSREAVLRALAAQCGVRYLAAIDQTAVKSAPGHLSPDEVRALGIVPFSETGERLQVACTAPLPYAALDAVTTLIGRQVEPYLVSDDDFVRLQNAYVEGADGGDRAVTTTTVRDIKDGASRIAAAAARAGDVTVKEANVDAYTWVRIAANGRISTLLVPPYPQQLEEHDAWLAATTRH
jgi:hypothetical protein